MITVYVNTYDLEQDLGLPIVMVEEIEGWLANVAYDREYYAIPGTYENAVSPDARVAPKIIRMTPMLSSTLITARDQDMNSLLDIFTGELEIRFADSLDKCTRGYLAKESARAAFGPDTAWFEPRIDIPLDIVCPNPVRVDYNWQSVSFGITERTPIPLGNIPSFGRLRIAGPATNPVVTYRSADGGFTATQGFTVTLDAYDWLDVDLRLKQTTLYNNGVISDGRTLWDRTTKWLMPSPAHGSYRDAAWPTFQINSGSGVYIYERRWR